jgi:hypothetical protein
VRDEVFLASKYMVQSPCPRCGQLLNGLTHASFNKPSPPGWVPKKGDFSICANCGAVLRFESDRRLRLADSADMLQLKNEDPKTFTLLGKMGAAAQQRIMTARRSNYWSN